MPTNNRDYGLNNYDFDGNPISNQKATALYLHPERFVAQDTINGRLVSTVWVGLDLSFGHAPKPLIYETMIFSSESPEEDIYTKRYATREEALTGHQYALTYAKTIPETTRNDDV